MPYPIAFSLDRRIDALLPSTTPANARTAAARGQARQAQLAAPAPPAPPAPPGPSAAVVRVLRKQGDKAPPARELQAARERHAIVDAADRTDGVIIAACAEREPGQRGDDQSDDGDGDQAVAAGTGEPGDQEGLDCALIAALLGQFSDSGMFEVLLPGGATLGVAVDVRPEAVDYLFIGASVRLAAYLRDRQMELAGQLGRQIGRSVRITVL